MHLLTKISLDVDNVRMRPGETVWCLLHAAETCWTQTQGPDVQALYSSGVNSLNKSRFHLGKNAAWSMTDEFIKYLTVSYRGCGDTLFSYTFR